MTGCNFSQLNFFLGSTVAAADVPLEVRIQAQLGHIAA